MIYSGTISSCGSETSSRALAGEQLARVHLDDDYRSVVLEETLAYDMGRIRDVRQVLKASFISHF